MIDEILASLCDPNLQIEGVVLKGKDEEAAYNSAGVAFSNEIGVSIYLEICIADL